MTPRCVICGSFESENKSICLEVGDACYDCLTSLVDNEMDRRGNQDEEFRSQSGDDVLANVQDQAQRVR